MRPELLERLRCPRTAAKLMLERPVMVDGRIESAELVTPDGTHRYPVIRFVPRFVPRENYADNFGFQWNRFRQTQLDSHTGRPISQQRFYSFTGWTPDMLRGRRVLDVGCGAGRFTEIALAAGAEVTAVDFSSAVDACWLNNGPNPALDVVQADVYSLPFEPGTFDFVYCLGVLQHTPDPRAAFLSLPRQLRAGGRLAADLYPREDLNVFHPRYWLRPVTTRLPRATLFRIVERIVPVLLPVSNLVGRVPRVGRKLRNIVPVANYRDVLDLSPQQQAEWSVLDTFDWYSPQYDQPQSADTIGEWLREAGVTDPWVGRMGFNIARGRKPPVREDNGKGAL